MFKLIKFLLVLALILAAIGYWRGWFTIEKSGDDQFTVSIDRDKVRDDTSKAKDAVKDVASKFASRKVEGRLAGLDVMQGRIEVEEEGGERVSFKLDQNLLKAASADAALLMSLAQGDQVVIHYDEKDGERIVKKVEKKK